MVVYWWWRIACTVFFATSPPFLLFHLLRLLRRTSYEKFYDCIETFSIRYSLAFAHIVYSISDITIIHIDVISSMCTRLLPSLISYDARWIVGAYVVALVPANIYILLKYPHLEKQVTKHRAPLRKCLQKHSINNWDRRSFGNRTLRSLWNIDWIKCAFSRAWSWSLTLFIVTLSPSTSTAAQQRLSWGRRWNWAGLVDELSMSTSK